MCTFKLVFPTLLAVLSLPVLSCSDNRGSYSRPPRAVAPRKPNPPALISSTPIGSRELWEEFDRDSTAAHNKYLGKDLLVTGQALGLDSASKGSPTDSFTIYLRQDPSWLMDVKVSLPYSERGTVQALYEGRTITVRATYQGGGVVGGTISLANGSLQNKPALLANQVKAKKASEGVPPNQVALIKVLNDFKTQYLQSNEFKRANLRANRKAEISRALSGSLVYKDWIGTIEDLSVNSFGEGELTIRLLGSEATIGTWNNFISDLDYETLIKPDSRLFKQLSDLQKGDVVTVSGVFIGSDVDFMYETSMTDKGSFTQPEFITRFSTLSEVVVE